MAVKLMNAKCKSEDIASIFDRNVHICKYNLVSKTTISLMKCLNDKKFYGDHEGT